MKNYARGGIFRKGMEVPQDIDGGSAPAPRPKNTTGSKRRPAKKMAKGGSIDGCAIKGKTKGAMVAMAKGGKTC